MVADDVAATALVLDVVFLVVAFGVRTAVQWRRTRDTGWRLGKPRTAAEGAARGLLFGAAALLAASVVDGLLDSEDLDVVNLVGVVIGAAAIALVLVAQLQMGASWRIGVDPDERTALVTAGLYRWIRNPIYTGMVLFTAGQFLMLPSAWSVAALVAMAAGVEVQVRAVEEPYLRGVHGTAYASWESTAGRFVPLLGRT